jgi:peroxiredoxin
MSTLQIQKKLVLAALGLGIGGVLFHAGFKPPPEARVVAGITSYMEESTRWQGKLPPDFSLSLRSGETFRLADHIGRKVIILNFFTTWCQPCKEEMPELNAYIRKHRGSPLMLVGINIDEKPDKVDAFCKELGVAFPVGIDTNSTIAGQYGVSSYPTTVLIGADGRVGLFQIGGIANADVVFASSMPEQFKLIRENRGIARAAYEAGLTSQVSPPGVSRPHSSKTKEPKIKLDGPSKPFAERMNCPSCGSSLYTCECGICDSVKKNLSKMSVTNKTDEQILRELFMEAKCP